MFCLKHHCVSLAIVGALLLSLSSDPRAQLLGTTQTNTAIHLHWGQRSGISRYRLQIAHDQDFSDIVFDRVIRGNEITINELSAGRYFWRVAPMTNQLGEFSTVAIVDVAESAAAKPSPTPRVISQPTSNQNLIAVDGWRAAIGNVTSLKAAHLRAGDRTDVVATTTTGITYALDALSGVAFWSRRGEILRTAGPAPMLFVVQSLQLDDVAVVQGSAITRLNGATGRQVWRATLPASSTSAAVVGDKSSASFVIVDNSSMRLFIMDARDGHFVSNINLSAPVVGAPVSFRERGGYVFALAYENGQVEIRDQLGRLLQSGSAFSAATTAPLFVRAQRGDLVLVGTRAGLTAMAADGLRPLGRVTLKGDFPRGSLTTLDLDRTGFAEVLMNTQQGHVVAISADDGKVLWDVDVQSNSDSFAFADVNGDGIPDVIVQDRYGLIRILSSHDGSQVWKESTPTLITNQTTTSAASHVVSVSSVSGILIVAGDSSGARAIRFQNARIRPIFP